MGLIVEAADTGVASEGLVVQYVAAVSDGVDGDGAEETYFDWKAYCSRGSSISSEGKAGPRKGDLFKKA